MNEYPGDRWRQRVLHMRDAQVLAIFKSIRTRPRKKRRREKPKGEQLSMDLAALFLKEAPYEGTDTEA